MAADDIGRTEKVRRHVYWARTQGVGRLIEEDQLDPRERASIAWSKWRWRRRFGVEPGDAVPVFLLGLQRSGTNMVTRGFDRAPEVEVYNENQKAAFTSFRLKPLPAVANLVSHSHHRYVLFKPLCDSHRAIELLGTDYGAQPARVLWVVRSVDGRARSAVNKFGDANQKAMRAIKSGTAGDMWQAQGLSEESLALIADADLEALGPLGCAALFWLVRNQLFFEQGLHLRSDVLATSYESVVQSPDAATKRLCAFLGFPWRPDLIDGDARSVDPPRLELPEWLRTRCDQLTERFDEVIAQG